MDDEFRARPDHSEVPRIVLDSNVLYASLYSVRGTSYQLLRAILDGRVRIALSTPLLFEYEPFAGNE